MDRQDLAALVETGNLLSVFPFYLSHRKVLSSIVPSSYATKVIFQSLMCVETEQRLTRVQLHTGDHGFRARPVDLRLLLDPWR